MNRIQIVAVPRGEAPLAVRQAWVGLVLEYLWAKEFSWLGIVSRTQQPKRMNYLVDTAHALGVLEQKDKAAADWFRTAMQGRIESEALCFGEDEVRVLEDPIPFRYSKAELD